MHGWQADVQAARAARADPGAPMLASYGLAAELRGALWGQGLEFQVAYATATELGIPVTLGDRDVDITLKRLRASVSAADLLSIGPLLSPGAACIAVCLWNRYRAALRQSLHIAEVLQLHALRSPTRPIRFCA